MSADGRRLAAAALAAALAFLAPPVCPALSLEEAWGLLLQRAPALEAQRALVRRAEAALAEARANRGPELRFTAAAGLLADPPEGITVEAGELAQAPIVIPPQDLVFVEDARHAYMKFSAELQQPLYTWGKLRRAAELTAGEAQVQRLRLQQRQRELRRELQGLYFGALAARQSIPLLEEAVLVLEELAGDRRRAAALGESTRLGVLEMDSRVANAEGQLLRTREAEATALQALGLLLDLSPEKIELSTSFRQELHAARAADPEEDLWGRALAVSAELRLARQELQLAETAAALRRAGAAPRPDLRLSLELSVAGQTVPWSEPAWSDTWDWDLRLGVGTQGALLDAGRSRARIRQAEEGAAASRAAVELAVRQLRLALRQAVQELRVRQGELAEREAALSEAAEAERAARAAFEQQAGTRERWGLARLRLIQCRLQVLDARAALESAAAALEYLSAP